CDYKSRDRPSHSPQALTCCLSQSAWASSMCSQVGPAEETTQGAAEEVDSTPMLQLPHPYLTLKPDRCTYSRQRQPNPGGWSPW
ncbi:Hypothetical predicted protein, partial [Pelobates cultripes]